MWGQELMETLYILFNFAVNLKPNLKINTIKNKQTNNKPDGVTKG